jgi:hypothetical protein
MKTVPHSVTLLHVTPDPERVIERAGRLCRPPEGTMRQSILVRSSASIILVLATACGGGGSTGGATPNSGGTPAAATPTLIRSGLPFPGNIIVDTSANELYWVDFQTNSLTAVPTNGGSGVVFGDFSGGAPVFDLAQTTLSVFVSQSDFGSGDPLLYKIQKPASVGVAAVLLCDHNSVPWQPADTRLTLGMPLTGVTPSGVTVSSASPGVVYFADSFASGIGAIPVNGGAITVVHDNPNDNGFGPLACLAADSLGLYWTPYGATGQMIYYYSFTGTALGSAGPYSNIFGLVAYQPGGSSTGAGDLFFIDQSSGSLFQIQIAGATGGSQTLLATNAGGANSARSLTVDDTFVYYITQGAIAKVPIASTSGSVLATPQVLVSADLAGNPVSLAVDATNLYWTAVGSGSGGGFVSSIPK